MNWKIWKKKPAEEEAEKPQMEKLSKPKEIPQAVGRYLVVDLGKDPDWVWNLKGAVRQRPESKDAFDVRVFEESEAVLKKVKIKDYTSLDAHPDLILFEGWYDKRKNKVEVREKKTETSRAA